MPRQETAGEQKNREWLKRAHLVLDAQAQDALSRAGYNGTVTLELVINNGQLIGMDATAQQKIRR